jgi:hypothetical protein
MNRLLQESSLIQESQMFRSHAMSLVLATLRAGANGWRCIAWPADGGFMEPRNRAELVRVLDASMLYPWRPAPGLKATLLHTLAAGASRAD